MDKLNINCSSGTFQRVQNDEEYREQVASHVLEKERSTYNEIIFSQIEPAEKDHGQQSTEQIQSQEAAEVILSPTEPHEYDGGQDISGELLRDGDEKRNWLEAPTKLMLAINQDLRPKLGKSLHVKTKSKMYKLVSEGMAKKGHIFTTTQIENKFRGLERRYKKMILNNKQTGRNRQTCPYQSELSQILGEKRGINSEFVLESGDLDGTPRSVETIDDASSDMDQSLRDDVPSCSIQASKRRKMGVREAVVEKIEELVEEKKSPLPGIGANEEQGRRSRKKRRKGAEEIGVIGDASQRKENIIRISYPSIWHAFRHMSIRYALKIVTAAYY